MHTGSLKLPPAWMTDVVFVYFHLKAIKFSLNPQRCSTRYQGFTRCLLDIIQVHFVLYLLDYINITLQKCCCLLYILNIQVQQILTFPFSVSLSVLRQRFFCLLTDIVYSFNHACFHCRWLCQYILMNEGYTSYILFTRAIKQYILNKKNGMCDVVVWRRAN